MDNIPSVKEVIVKPMGAVRYGDAFIMRCVGYEAMTREGDCGLPVFIADSSTRCEKIAGFHVAARADHRLGYGNIITQELLERVLVSSVVVP